MLLFTECWQLARAMHITFLMLDREPGLIGMGQSGFRVNSARPDRSHATADDVGVDHKIFFGVDPFPRTDHVIPPAGIFIFRFIITGNVGIP